MDCWFSQPTVQMSQTEDSFSAFKANQKIHFVIVYTLCFKNTYLDESLQFRPTVTHVGPISTTPVLQWEWSSAWLIWVVGFSNQRSRFQYADFILLYIYF